jgi:hypothetical protein
MERYVEWDDGSFESKFYSKILTRRENGYRLPNGKKRKTVTHLKSTPHVAAAALNKKRPRQEGEPKRPLSSYFLFSMQTRPLLQKKYPGLGFGEYGKKLGELWKKLSPAGRAPFEDEATRLKEEYAVEYAKWADTN